MALDEKNIIVSGGSRGIGRAIALHLAEHGANVTFTYLKNAAAAESVLEEGRRCQGSIRAYQADVRNERQMQNLISDIIQKYGSIDVIVNNAGVRKDRTLAFMPSESWHDVLDTNLTGAFYLTQAAIPHMLKRKAGRIINISSISGLQGIAGQTNYSAAKAALIGFTKSLAKEAAPYGICVNAIALGGTSTEMVSAMPEKAQQRLLQGVPIGRMCTPEEAAPVVRFLADEELSPAYLTGAVIPLDGGMGTS